MKPKRILILLAAFLLAGLTSCTRHTVIPDSRLADIFHDIFLANAYTASDINRINLDSMRLYEPILNKYGYTSEDVQYTIGNFSKRKSARLGDVVEAAIARLDREGEHYKHEVAILDTIDNVARRTFSRRIFADTLIRVGRLKDTARLSMDFDLQPGEYILSLEYLIDSLDRNGEKGLRAEVWVERNDKQRSFYQSVRLARNRTESFRRRFTTDTAHKRLHVRLLNFNGRPQRPSITVRDMKIEYKPQAETAVDSLFARQMDLKLFTDDYFKAFAPKTDSVAPRVERK